MRVFLTGATGFIGSHLIPELLAGGHQVLGMTRSESGAAALRAAGVEPHHAALEDLDAIRAGTRDVDAVIHTAFDHEFSNFVANCEKDGRVIDTLGEALRGSARPLVITSGIGFGSPDDHGLAVEDVFNPNHPNPRITSERAGLAALDAGVDVRVIRLPQVHDTVKQGLITPLIDISRAKGVVGYVGDGSNRWAAGHVDDAARLYRLVLEKGTAGERYHAVGEAGVSALAIVETIAAGLGLPMRSLSPEEAQAHFGWMALFAGLDMAASNALTRQRLDWHPTGPGLIEDLKAMDYGTATAA